MKHELKIWPTYFEAVKDGSKTFEYRKNDRGFQKGDEVIFNEWNPEILPNVATPIGYTEAFLVFKIGYVLPVSETHVVFSLLTPDCEE